MTPTVLPRPVRVAEYVEAHATPGDPENVLRTIDRFAREVRWLMNVGPDKGPLVAEMAGRLPSEVRGLVGPGTIVVADNVGELFNPDEYLGYVRTSRQAATAAAPGLHDSSGESDVMPVRCGQK